MRKNPITCRMQFDGEYTMRFCKFTTHHPVEVKDRQFFDFVECSSLKEILMTAVKAFRKNNGNEHLIFDMFPDDPEFGEELHAELKKLRDTL